MALAIVVAVLVLGYVVFVYNRLVSLRLACRRADADITVQYSQRHDLIPNLIETVRGYARHERETLEAVVTARRAAVAAVGSADRNGIESELTGAVHRVIGLAEAYPELRASESFLRLQSELTDVENKIAAARRFFNRTVGEYNAACEQVPAAVFAKALGFSATEFHALTGEELEAARRPPRVSF
ncbi:MAG: LemA family protein [Bauldia sp.]|nr:LemA family protein [Bauldia sp.]